MSHGKDVLKDETIQANTKETESNSEITIKIEDVEYSSNAVTIKLETNRNETIMVHGDGTQRTKQALKEVCEFWTQTNQAQQQLISELEKNVYEFKQFKTYALSEQSALLAIIKMYQRERDLFWSELKRMHQLMNASIN